MLGRKHPPNPSDVSGTFSSVIAKAGRFFGFGSTSLMEPLTSKSVVPDITTYTSTFFGPIVMEALKRYSAEVEDLTGNRVAEWRLELRRSNVRDSFLIHITFLPFDQYGSLIDLGSHSVPFPESYTRTRQGVLIYNIFLLRGSEVLRELPNALFEQNYL
jgi:hypothetical protein